MMNDLNNNSLSRNGEEEMTNDSPNLVLAQPMGDKKIPLFLEFFMTATKVMVLVAGLVVALVSFLARATWYDTLLRVVITLFVLGLFGVLLNYFIGRNFVDAAVVELEEAEAKRKLLMETEEAESTMDALEA